MIRKKIIILNGKAFSMAINTINNFSLKFRNIQLNLLSSLLSSLMSPVIELIIRIAVSNKF
jgi:hypothetical protein